MCIYYNIFIQEMSHEYTLFPTEEEEFPLIEIQPVMPEVEIVKKIEPIESYNFFSIPSEPEGLRDQFQGLQFEGVQYTWEEFDFRLDVEYVPSVPEPADAGLFTALIMAAFVAFCYFKNKQGEK